jgi:hypothetical protein
LRFYRSIEERALQIQEPSERLRFLRTAGRRRTVGKVRHLTAFVAIACTCLSTRSLPLRASAPLPRVPRVAAASETNTARIYLAEHLAASDLYSNGLEIRNSFQTTSVPRSYKTYASATLEPAGPRKSIVGLVFHTTESLLFPLEPERASSVNQTRDALLEFVRNHRLYNFVIDRFGQVFRIVPEDQVALHAGHSIWGTGTDLWINLNESFVGIAFEARTGEEATAPQIHAGRLLTSMLRSVHGIPDANCVTHAQVSINPDNLRIGYHTDWAAHFPFAELGLNSGYRAPVASVERFGFSYDEAFLGAIGGHPWEGLVAADKQIIFDAAVRGVTADRYRQQLQQDYKAIRRLHIERIKHERS